MPQGQIYFDVHIFSLLYSFCPTLRCNSGGRKLYLLLTSSCNSDVGNVLFPFEYFSHHDATLVREDYVLSLHHDATLVLGTFCCASGPDLFLCAHPSLFSRHSFLHSDATLVKTNFLPPELHLGVRQMNRDKNPFFFFLFCILSVSH